MFLKSYVWWNHTINILLWKITKHRKLLFWGLSTLGTNTIDANLGFNFFNSHQTPLQKPKLISPPHTHLPTFCSSRSYWDLLARSFISFLSKMGGKDTFKISTLKPWLQQVQCLKVLESSLSSSAWRDDRKGIYKTAQRKSWHSFLDYISFFFFFSVQPFFHSTVESLNTPLLCIVRSPLRLARESLRKVPQERCTI